MTLKPARFLDPKAVELAQESAYTPAELEACDEYEVYDEYLEIEQTVRQDSYDEGRQEGEQIGLEKGVEKERQEIARKMLAQGLAMEIISTSTGLEIEDIKKLLQ